MSAAPSGSPPVQSRRHWVLLLVLLVGGAGVAGWYWLRPRAPNPPTAPEGTDPAVAAAINSAREAVTAEPTSAAAWGRLGLLFTAHGLDEPSAACYREARRLDPADDRWPYLLGLYHRHESRDPAAAIHDFEAALACPHRSPAKEAAARLRLAEQYLAERRLADAERLFRDQLSRDPADARANLGLGVALLNADRPADATEFLKAAAKSPLAARQANTNLAAAARLLGDSDTAAKYELRVAQLPDDPLPPDPFTADAAALRVSRSDGFEKVTELMEAGRARETVPILARLVEEHPTEARAAVVLGETLPALGDLEGARRYLRVAVDRDPENAKAALLLGTVSFDLAERERADPERRTQLYRESADACRRAVERKPDMAMAHFCRGKATQALGDLPAAVPQFRRAVECRPEAPLFQLGLLRALVDSGQTDEAKARLPAAERIIQPGDKELLRLKEQLAGQGGSQTLGKP